MDLTSPVLHTHPKGSGLYRSPNNILASESGSTETNSITHCLSDRHSQNRSHRGCSLKWLRCSYGPHLRDGQDSGRLHSQRMTDTFFLTRFEQAMQFSLGSISDVHGEGFQYAKCFSKFCDILTHNEVNRTIAYFCKKMI